MSAPGPARSELDLPLAVPSLVKGVVYRDTQPVVWRNLVRLQPQVRDFVAVMGLVVVVDESEGYAFLRARPEDDEDRPAIPRLVARRSLSFHVSLLLALLRKKLAEFDAANSDTRLVLHRDRIVEMVRSFLPDGSNEARLVDQIDAHLTKIVDLGFVRRVPNQKDTFEVRRILKAFVDAQWLSDFDQRLARYAAELAGADLAGTGAGDDRAGGDPAGGDPAGSGPAESRSGGEGDS